MSRSETIAQALRRAKHAVFGASPSKLVATLRRLAFRLVYLMSGGKGRRVRVAGEFRLYVEWERLAVNFESFEVGFTRPFGRLLVPGMTVFDVGASLGEWSVLAASRAGAGAVHVFEPNLPSWVRIRKIFELNGLGLPGGLFRGFVAETDRFLAGGLDRLELRSWPDAVEGPPLFEDLRNPGDIPSIRLDSYCRLAGVVPRVIKIDVEGAEGMVLRSGVETLRSTRPTIFLSLHPWLLSGFGDTKEGILGLLEDLGYQNEHLASDHEEHWLARPRAA